MRLRNMLNRAADSAINLYNDIATDFNNSVATDRVPEHDHNWLFTLYKKGDPPAEAYCYQCGCMVERPK